jgi:hypothetical protein
VDRVALPGASAFGADAKLTVVAYPAGISQDKGDRLVLATFDATGKRRGTRNFWNASHERIAAVLGGRVFVLLWIKTGVELLALGPDLGVQKRVLVSREESGNLRLETRDGRLQAITGYPVPHAVEFSASLETLGPATPLEYPRPIELGDEEVHLCEFYGRAWIAWSTTSQDACHASPADLLEAPPADD